MPITDDYPGGLAPEPEAEPEVRTSNPRLDRVLDQVQKGLPSKERSRIERCRESLDFYNLESWKHWECYLRREHEKLSDFRARPKEVRHVVHSAVNQLCQHLYNPGPQRQHPDPDTDAALQWVYTADPINERAGAADVRCTLHGASAIQVHATGDPDLPLRFYTYGGDEFCAFTKEDDPAEPEFVLTISPKLWELWTDEWIYSWEIRPEAGKPLSAKPNGPPSKQPNALGFLPFAFFHNEPPVRDFWECGLGSPLTEANKNIDRVKSDIIDGSRTFMLPTGVARNVQPGTTLNLKPGVVNSLGPGNNGKDPTPEIEWISGNFDSRSERESAQMIVDDVLRDLNVPPGAVRLDAGESGISKVVDSLPLLTRATRRQTFFSRYEQALAKVALRVFSAWYGVPLRWEVPIVVTWPRLRLPVPVPEIEEPAYRRYNEGIASKIDLLMMLDGLTREEAEAKLAQVQQDNANDPERQAALGMMGGAVGVPVQQEEGRGQGQDGGGEGEEEAPDGGQEEAG